MKLYIAVAFLFIILATVSAQFGAGIGSGNGGPGIGTPGFSGNNYMGAGAGPYGSNFGRKRRFAFIP